MRALIALPLVASLACEARPAERPEQPPAPPPAPAPIAPAPAPAPITVAIPDSGTYVDYQWATASASADTLLARLEAFVERHGPIDGAFEDAVHVRFWRMALFRLARQYYHAGRMEDGDRILRQLEETDERIR